MWRRFEAVLVPWVWYLTVTLLVPALNGAYERSAFRSHALVVLTVSSGIVAAWIVLRVGLSRAIGRARPPGRTRVSAPGP